MSKFILSNKNNYNDTNLINTPTKFLLKNSNIKKETIANFTFSNITISNRNLENKSSIQNKLKFPTISKLTESNNLNDKLKKDFNNKLNEMKLSETSNKNTSIKTKENFLTVEKIGVGNFGNIYKILNLKLNTYYSCKIVKNSKYYHIIENEIFFLSLITKKFRSKYLLKYYESWKYENTYYLITEWCLGSIDKILGNIIIEEKTIFKIIKHICKGLFIMHSNGILHLDIKPENICLGNDNKFKLIDFGFSNYKNSYKTLNEGDSKYMSMEFLEKNKNIDFTKSDIFSLGLTIYKLISRIELKGNGIIFKSIRKGINNLESISFYSKSLKYLVKCMINPDWRKRPGCEEILKFIKNIKISNKKKSRNVST